MTIQFNDHRVLVTRNEPKASEFSEQIAFYGGRAIITPLIKIQCVPDVKCMNLVDQIEAYEWLVFTSANGVRCFFENLDSYDWANRIRSVHVAVVGSGTHDALRVFGFEADFVPSIYNAETLAAELISQCNPKGPILLVRGQLSKTTLNEALREKAIPFDSIEVYETVTNVEAKPLLQHALSSETFDFITFTSPSTVDAFVALTEESQRPLHTINVCIGTTTKKRALEYGFHHVLVPDVFTINGMIQKMYEHISNEDRGDLLDQS